LAAMVVEEEVAVVPVRGQSSLKACEWGVEQAAAVVVAAARGPRNSHRYRSYLRSTRWVLQVMKTSVAEHEWRPGVHARKVAVTLVAL
jgi:hypothetical protein